MIGSILTLLITLLLGSMIFVRGRGGKIVRSYFLLMLSIAVWAFGMYMLTLLQTAKYTMFWLRFSHIGAACIPIFYFHFLIKLIGLADKRKALTVFGYIFALCFCILGYMPYMIEGFANNFGMIYLRKKRFIL